MNLYLAPIAAVSAVFSRCSELTAFEMVDSHDSAICRICEPSTLLLLMFLDSTPLGPAGQFGPRILSMEQATRVIQRIRNANSLQ